ncbi:MAG: hypothetical protein ABJF07_26370, partial [Nisaea sp.]|uniref:hypothetical protein n=1 Tax=Nisaea sp. TaxID=2024842 RepID=UPI00326468C2
MPLAVSGIGPAEALCGNEVGRNTIARAICPSVSGGNVRWVGAVVAGALPVAPDAACWAPDAVLVCAEERGWRSACSPLSDRCRIR